MGACIVSASDPLRFCKVAVSSWLLHHLQRCVCCCFFIAPWSFCSRMAFACWCALRLEPTPSMACWRLRKGLHPLVCPEAGVANWLGWWTFEFPQVLLSCMSHLAQITQVPFQGKPILPQSAYGVTIAFTSLKISFRARPKATHERL